jgi:hypothetical protein
MRIKALWILDEPIDPNLDLTPLIIFFLRKTNEKTKVNLTF